jgi:hypothetical protein
VARKLAILLHHLWATGEVYEPLRNSQAEAPLKGASQARAKAARSIESVFEFIS